MWKEKQNAKSVKRKIKKQTKIIKTEARNLVIKALSKKRVEVIEKKIE